MQGRPKPSSSNLLVDEGRSSRRRAAVTIPPLLVFPSPKTQDKIFGSKNYHLIQASREARAQVYKLKLGPIFYQA